MTEPLDTLTHVPGRAAEGDRLYFLVLEEDSSAIFRLPENGRIVIGREAGVDLCIRDRAASRRHAELHLRNGEVDLVDLDSHNGTLVNGARLTGRRPLLSGDVVAIGSAALVFHSARTAGLAQRVMDFAALQRRLAEEIERATHFQRPLSVGVMQFREPPNDPGTLAQAVAAHLRPVDFLAWSDPAQLVLVLPELAAVRAPGPVDLPLYTLGAASHPDDGDDPDALIAAARAASGTTAPGETTRVALDDRAILLADPAMLRLFELVRRLARSDLPVLITGETGVGKESAAFAVHHWSRRAAGRFLPVNCAALPENLLESELFGFEKGAFSGATQAKPGLLELASGGSVFFDEVGELSAGAQAKLLRVLETKRIMRLGGTREIDIDVRVIAATNRKLEREVADGRFRSDLFFRLSGATVVLPPLRDRPRELAVLLRAFLIEACARLSRPPLTLSREALAALHRYPWPGNVRELKNAIEYAAAAAEERVELEHLPPSVLDHFAPSEALPDAAPAAALAAPLATLAEPLSPAGKARFRPLADEIEELERARLREALVAAGGVKARAARLIDMPLRTFITRLKQYGIASDGDDSAP